MYFYICAYVLEVSVDWCECVCVCLCIIWLRVVLGYVENYEHMNGGIYRVGDRICVSCVCVDLVGMCVLEGFSEIGVVFAI